MTRSSLPHDTNLDKALAAGYEFHVTSEGAMVYVTVTRGARTVGRVYATRALMALAQAGELALADLDGDQ